MKIGEDTKKIRNVRAREAIITLPKKWDIDYKNCTDAFYERNIDRTGKIWWKLTFGEVKKSENKLG